ncbi:GumC family protein [Roseospira navarrensis]|uniref:Polysaccharide chain length determinant N-terminal domain-containing protein n=1 Tax=Roseospira navarrensis TaxID=140058 RepID=A0A7X1ZCA7_9PROT|nr:Wzz/FepE/Etk N-terminal domain-containing protein [Roseospira navarrensis]MQX35344.1 hypothetical protein [Roseospira navarrensis]
MNMQSYEDDEKPFEFDLGLIWRVARRRFWFFVLPTLFFGSIALVAAKLLPPSYMSKATIAIEQPNVPADLINSTVTSIAAERIELIRQRFIATDNLVRLIREHDLYPWRRETETLTQIASTMRDDISVQLIQQKSGRETYTVAFSVGFSYRSPAKAKAVADALVSWYLSENARTRQERAQETASFLEQETRAAEQEVDRLANELANWRAANRDRLPAQQPMILEQLNAKRLNLRDATFRLEALQGEKTSLEAKLEAMRGDVANASSGPSAGAVEAARLNTLLTDLRSRRVALSTTYTDRHPDMARLDRQIAEIQSQLSRLPAAAVAGASSGANPGARIEEMELRLEAMDRSIRLTERSIAVIEAEIQEAEQQLEESAKVADSYQALVRAHQSAVEDFNVLRRKQMAADMGASLEINQKAERFTLIEPPQLPSQREGLPPLLIALGGIVASGGLGVGSMAGAEFLDKRLRSTRKVEEIVGAAPLIVIPEIRTRRERILRWTIRIAVMVSILTATIGGLWYVHTQVKPLDILIIILERKIETQINALGL